MGRPTLRYKPTKVVIPASPLLVAYLEALMKKEMYGSSRPEVAKTLCWRMIEDLIGRGIVDQIKDDDEAGG
jgi:hypothetical protein